MVRKSFNGGVASTFPNLQSKVKEVGYIPDDAY